MKNQFLLAFLVTGLALPLAAAEKHSAPAAAPAAAFKDAAEKNGYALGLNIGNNLRRQGLTPELLSSESFARGFKDALSASKPQLTEQQVGETLQALQQAVMENRKVAAAQNKTAGEKFLAENKSKPGIVTLPSGLQYQILTAGKGENPKPDHSVTVNYRGTLLDGTEVESSYKRGQPATFRLASVPILGLNEALQLMSPGAKWRLFIPANLAYGERGNANIPPDSALTFEVELLATAAPPPVAAPQPITSDIIRVPSAEEIKNGAKIETIKADQIKSLTEKAPK